MLTSFTNNVMSSPRELQLALQKLEKHVDLLGKQLETLANALTNPDKKKRTKK